MAASNGGSRREFVGIGIVGRGDRENRIGPRGMVATAGGCGPRSLQKRSAVRTGGSPGPLIIPDWASAPGDWRNDRMTSVTEARVWREGGKLSDWCAAEIGMSLEAHTGNDTSE